MRRESLTTKRKPSSFALTAEDAVLGNSLDSGGCEEVTEAVSPCSVLAFAHNLKFRK